MTADYRRKEYLSVETRLCEAKARCLANLARPTGLANLIVLASGRLLRADL